MCGICGIVGDTPQPLGPRLKAMNRAQIHRGPDGRGYYFSGTPHRLFQDSGEEWDEPASCGLAHCRLAILDPRDGAQPMVSEDGMTATLLNGEIYNFREIRERLRQRGCRFRTDCDTEILEHLYRQSPESPAAWLRELNGIFALAIWDNTRHRLLIARDHFGVKPLHYFAEDGACLFASEIKAILAAGVRPHLNRAALHVFMNVRYIPGPETLFRGIYRLPPAHYAWIENGKVRGIERFYRLPDNTGARGGADPRDVREQVRDAFHLAVENQLLSDVPVGMALSGGLDSSMIVAAAAEAFAGDRSLRLSDRTLRTFTLGFNEPTDENEDARIVADHFRTEHYDMRLAADPLERQRTVIRAVEEPKINIMQGYELSRFVSSHVKVVFSGLGGDELFAGYDIHRFCNTLGGTGRFVPDVFRRRLLAPLSRGLWRLQNASGRLHREYYRIGAQIALATGDGAQFYCRLRNAWDFDEGMYARVYRHPDAFREYPATASYLSPYFDDGSPFLEQVLRAEFHTKMVNDFLVNEDRVTSAHGIEARVPFLDRNLVELAFSIPAAWKMSGTETKGFWKASVGQVLPKQILRKKKQGFTFSSYHQWTKDLRQAVESELTPEWCRECGIFNHRFVQDVLDYTPHPNLRWHYFMVWMMLGFKHWMETFDVEL